MVHPYKIFFEFMGVNMRKLLTTLLLINSYGAFSMSDDCRESINIAIDLNKEVLARQYQQQMEIQAPWIVKVIEDTVFDLHLYNTRKRASNNIKYLEEVLANDQEACMSVDELERKLNKKVSRLSKYHNLDKEMYTEDLISEIDDAYLSAFKFTERLTGENFALLDISVYRQFVTPETRNLEINPLRVKPRPHSLR